MRMGQERTELVFPPHLGRLSAPAALQVGERVYVRGRESLGTATVVSFNEDGRLAHLSFCWGDGWWHRADVGRVE